MITAVIIDDESSARMLLSDLLSQHCPDIHLLGQATGVVEGIKLIQEHAPQLVFLDVQMKDGTGFDLLSCIPNRTFKVVFVSAFDTYAINAFRVSAMDYLLKPVDPTELVRALEKISTSDDLQTKKIDALLANRKGVSKIALASMDELVFVEPDEIIRCQSDSNYTRFFLRSGQSILVSRTMKDFEEILEPLGFFRIHKSDLINLKYIQKYKRGEGGSVILTDGTELEVSRRRKEDFLKAIQL